MSTDPYHLLQHEIQTALSSASEQRASFLRIRSMSRDSRDEGEELVWARNELKATLASLEADLEDLEESVKIVESTDARFYGLTDAEVMERRKYVGRVRSEIQTMRAETSSSHSTSSGSSSPPPPSYHASQSKSLLGGGDSKAGGKSSSSRPQSPLHPTHVGRDEEEGEEGDHQGEWAREEQQMMIAEQDRTMDSIAGTLSTLARQAGLMGQEIGEQVEMLQDLESGVDETDNKLSGAMKKMRRFVRQTEQEKSGWCIIILIVVLMLLLLLVIVI